MYFYIGKHRTRDIMKVGVSIRPRQRLQELKEKFDIDNSICCCGSDHTIYTIEEDVLFTFRKYMVDPDTVKWGGHTEYLDSSILEEVKAYILDEYGIDIWLPVNNYLDKFSLGSFIGPYEDEWNVFVQYGELWLTGSDVEWEEKRFNECYWDYFDKAIEAQKKNDRENLLKYGRKMGMFNWIPYILGDEERDSLLTILREHGYEDKANSYFYVPITMCTGVPL